ncbi:hypothetical protein TrVFT333_005696 [Trichoderma virens FT-333]|nr:hypothetical protein TrVFT333_005696 [Trichoderma virens FT-333]
MSIEIGLGTPLADALNAAIPPKLVEVGWGTGGSDDSALAEYIILMLVNGKTQDQIAAELSGDLLNLPLDDPVVHEFSKWLFDQVHMLNAHGGQGNGGDSMGDFSGDAAGGDMDTDMGSHGGHELNAPTGPRSMRNGNGNLRGGRDKRMFGQMSKAMDRSHDNVLHRVRGQGAVEESTHTGVPPNWPTRRSRRDDAESKQQPRHAGRRNGWTQDPRHKNNFRRGQGQGQADANGEDSNMETGAEGEDVDMAGKREPPNPDETVCKYNLHCTNKDCKFAHQSPAAPPEFLSMSTMFAASAPPARTANASDVIPHQPQDLPTRANRTASSSPTVKTLDARSSTPQCLSAATCKYTPCLNPTCPFAHEEGQQGGFKDKVWTPGQGQEHVSERKFVDENAEEQLIKPETENKEEMVQDQEIIG